MSREGFRAFHFRGGTRALREQLARRHRVAGTGPS
jgi:hypothetical protein